MLYFLRISLTFEVHTHTHTRTHMFMQLNAGGSSETQPAHLGGGSDVYSMDLRKLEHPLSSGTIASSVHVLPTKKIEGP